MNINLKIMSTFVFLILGSMTQADETKENWSQFLTRLHQIGSPLTLENLALDCNDDFYKPTASHKSLYSWSGHHHQQAQEMLDNSLSASIPPRQPCYIAIQQRGAALCQDKENLKYKQGILETVAVCLKLFPKK